MGIIPNRVYIRGNVILGGNQHDKIIKVGWIGVKLYLSLKKFF